MKRKNEKAVENQIFMKKRSRKKKLKKNLKANTKFEKKVKEKLKKRQNQFSNESRFRLWGLFISTLSLILIFGFIYIFNEIKFEKTKETDLFFWCLQIFGILFLIIFSILLRKGPNDKIERDKWLWVHGKNLYLVKVLASLIGLILILQFLFFFRSDLLGNIIFVITFIGIPIFYLFYYGIVIFIFLNPSKINSIITVIGSLFHAKLFFLLSMACGIIFWNTYIPSLFVLMGLLSGISSLQFLKIFSNNSELNKVQEAVLKIVPPPIMYGTLSKQKEKIVHKFKAMKMLQKLYSKEEYGILQCLSEELVIIGNSSKNWKGKAVIILLISLGLFILTSIGEGLIQDLFNDDLKDFFCEIFGLFCKDKE